jgi:hypothetical protein
MPQESAPSGSNIERLVFAEDFANGSVSPKIEAAAPQPGIYNYFMGNDSEKWQTNVTAYAQLLYHDVWTGIDIRFVVQGADLEQEFLVHPGVEVRPDRQSAPYLDWWDDPIYSGVGGDGPC